MANVSVKWNGNDVNIKLDRARWKSVDQATLACEAVAKQLCPVSSGNLVGSIAHESKNFFGESWGIVFTPVYYGGYVELGTSKMDAQPFLRPAADFINGQFIRVVTKNGQTELADYLWGGSKGGQTL